MMIFTKDEQIDSKSHLTLGDDGEVWGEPCRRGGGVRRGVAEGTQGSGGVRWLVGGWENGMRYDRAASSSYLSWVIFTTSGHVYPPWMKGPHVLEPYNELLYVP